MKSRHILLTGAVAVTGLWPTLAQAQTPASDADRTVADRGAVPGDDIVVTARRREENINKVPIAITAFSGETLVRKGILNTRDLTKLTPGVNIVGSSTLLNPFITIRALSKGASGPGSPGVISYFNDVPMPHYGSIISSLDMDNIQVLKGPQGTLFGRNAIGGAVLTNSKRPTYEFGGYAEAEYGRFNSLRLEGAVNAPIIDGKLAVRLAAQSSRTNGYITADIYSPFTYDPATFSQRPGQLIEQGVHYDKREDISLRGSVLFEPTENVTSLTVVDYARAEGIAPGNIVGFVDDLPPAIYRLPPAVLASLGLANIYVPTYQCGTSPGCDINLAVANAQANPRRRTAGVSSPEYTTSFGVMNNTSISFGDIQLKNIFALRSVKSVINGDLDGVAQTIVDVTRSRVNLDQLTDELQLSGTALEDKLTFVAGAFYFHSKPKGLSGFQSNTINVFQGLVSSTATNFLEEKSRAVYGQADYDFSSFLTGLKLTAGYRYTWDKQSGCVYTAENGFSVGGIPTTPGVLPPLPTYGQCKSGAFPVDPGAVIQTTENQRAKSKRGTYTLTASWQATDEVMTYVTTRKGYRNGGFNSGSLPTTPVDTSSLRTFAPETLTDVEIGVKGRFNIGGTSGNFQFDAYRSKDKGFQSFQNLAGIGALPPNGLLINKADFTVQGIEGSLAISPVGGLTLEGNFAYTDIKLDRIRLPQALVDYINAVQPSGLAGVQGLVEIANQPKWTANAGLTYEVSDLVGTASGILNVDYHYQSAYQANIRVPGYSTIDARVTLDGLYDGAFDVSLFARNLTDKRYYLGPSSAPTLGINAYILAQPRQIGVSARVHFGAER